jgi:hypothetical protein
MEGNDHGSPALLSLLEPYSAKILQSPVLHVPYSDYRNLVGSYM